MKVWVWVLAVWGRALPRSGPLRTIKKNSRKWGIFCNLWDSVLCFLSPPERTNLPPPRSPWNMGSETLTSLYFRHVCTLNMPVWVSKTFFFKTCLYFVLVSGSFYFCRCSVSRQASNMGVETEFCLSPWVSWWKYRQNMFLLWYFSLHVSTMHPPAPGP